MGAPRGRDILLLMSFFAELKRRSVFRVAIGYVGVSWLILQVVDVLFGIFDYETDVDETIVIVLAIGFIPAMILAWAFELTPEGIKRDAETDHDAPAMRDFGRRIDRIVIAILSVAVVFFAVVFFAVIFFAVVFLAAAFFAPVVLAGAAFFVVVFFAAVVLAVAFFAAAFLAVALRAVAFFAAAFLTGAAFGSSASSAGPLSPPGTALATALRVPATMALKSAAGRNRTTRVALMRTGSPGFTPEA